MQPQNILNKAIEMKRAGEQIWLAELANRCGCSIQLIRYYVFGVERPSGRGGHLKEKFKLSKRMGQLQLVEVVE